MLGSGTANSGLAPINMDAYGSNLSAAILEIGATIGTDPGGNNADFSYQLIQPEANQIPTTFAVPGNGQIDLGFLGNTDDGVGFAAYSPTGTPRVVALYEDPNETYEGVQGNATTLATIQVKYGFGLGGGDHLTLGSSTSNATVVLLNTVDLNGGPQRRFVSIRGVGTSPEGEYSGPIIDTATSNLSFDGNGGLIFDSAASTYTTATLQVDGGAIFVSASDPAQGGTPGALGEGTATMQVGTGAAVNPSGGTLIPTTAGANLGFMTYGPNHGLGSTTPTEITNRNIVVGGTGVAYASAVLGGASDDYSAMNGNITLNGNLGSTTQVPTTFFARNGGLDFGGVISGAGGVVVGGIPLLSRAMRPPPESHWPTTGPSSSPAPTRIPATPPSAPGSSTSTAAASAYLRLIRRTLGGMGTQNADVTIADGGHLEAGQAGAGNFTLNNNLTFTGAGNIDYVPVQGSLNGVGNPQLIINGTLTTSNAIAINILDAINAGSYALLDEAPVSRCPLSPSGRFPVAPRAACRSIPATPMSWI